MDCLRGIMGTTTNKPGEKRVKTHYSNAEISSKSSGDSSAPGASRHNANCILCLSDLIR